MAVRAGRPVPDSIANAPELQPSLGLFMTAFWDLSHDRQVGQALGPIPWSSINTYADVYGFDDELREDLHVILRDMDRAYIDFQAAKAKAD